MVADACHARRHNKNTTRLYTTKDLATASQVFGRSPDLAAAGVNKHARVVANAIAHVIAKYTREAKNRKAVEAKAATRAATRAANKAVWDNMTEDQRREAGKKRAAERVAEPRKARKVDEPVEPAEASLEIPDASLEIPEDASPASSTASEPVTEPTTFQKSAGPTRGHAVVVVNPDSNAEPTAAAAVAAGLNAPDDWAVKLMLPGCVEETVTESNSTNGVVDVVYGHAVVIVDPDTKNTTDVAWVGAGAHTNVDAVTAAARLNAPKGWNVEVVTVHLCVAWYRVGERVAFAIHCSHRTPHTKLLRKARENFVQFSADQGCLKFKDDAAVVAAVDEAVRGNVRDVFPTLLRASQ
jgi:hypothetical protein